MFNVSSEEGFQMYTIKKSMNKLVYVTAPNIVHYTTSDHILA